MTPEQQFLLAKAQENSRAASMLLQQGFADIASRAYYTMFYLAEALLASQELRFSSHSAVVANFGKEFAKTGKVPKHLHQYLIKAQSARQVSDYGINVTVTSAEANELVLWAKEFLEVTESFLTQPKS